GLCPCPAVPDLIPYCSSCNSGAVEIASRPAEPSGAGFVSGSRRSDSAILILSEETDESFFPTSPYPGPFRAGAERSSGPRRRQGPEQVCQVQQRDRKSTRLNSSHGSISYAVFCL